LPKINNMESYIPISFLNDFIFCPRSIYFHQLYSKYNHQLYKQKVQLKGEAAHTTIDTKKYNTRKNILQGIEVFSEHYNLCGKIDLFDTESGQLTERKREIKTIYDGYVFQVYAQCHALREMGYKVKSIVLHDLIHNKNYSVQLPEENKSMQDKFESLIKEMNTYDMMNSSFEANPQKCNNCIYSNLCDTALC